MICEVHLLKFLEPQIGGYAHQRAAAPTLEVAFLVVLQLAGVVVGDSLHHLTSPPPFLFPCCLVEAHGGLFLHLMIK